ncbi:MAG: pyridoxal phosphate-dependent aminotransferase [Anaeromicrobium sp.]|jgi:aspartate aminotransferase|uniref:pyridoxal phosphate-dependent aminotransferase n=1 Tax=Anaeromicrobium sp. TaxID=1929132 RepID=UPI0025D177CC|nr:pyridoxal phosphate-dependent aminotransferase [Anaeromicrobium sp.]MCT4594713.1 pyridoxal phosphate-dependent aminotransferase [Anaeromicrobium sp.]
MSFSKRILSMDESPIRKLTPYAEEAKSQNKKVYHLNIGQPDIETPHLFMNKIKNSEEKIISYTNSTGNDELIDSFIEFYKNYNLAYERDEILITNGASEGLLFTLMALGDVGDEVIIPEPFYTNYKGICASIGLNVVPITTKIEDSFHLPPKEDFVNKITDKTKAILISNPSNPTGVVYTKEEIETIANIAKEHNLYVISDEVYRDFVYDDNKFHSFGEINHIKDRIILIDSLSKRFSACGARIGSIVSKNKLLIKEILKLCQLRLCCPMLEQIGATELLKTPKEYVISSLDTYKKRKDVLYEELKKIPNVTITKPEGAFYIVIKLPVKDAEDFCIWLLKDFSFNNETVMLAPAKNFYGSSLGHNEVRIAYVIDENELKRASHVLKIGLEKYILEKGC